VEVLHQEIQGDDMPTLNVTKYIFVSTFLVLIGSTAHARTLSVYCGSTEGLSSIGAALKTLQNSAESRGPSTINVSGACNEDVVIQSIDRLTLNAVNGASINDPSGGNISTVTIDDSRDVAINGFTINGGQDGIDCQNGSLCRLTGNIVANSANDGVGVWAFSMAEIAGGTLVSNGFAGLQVANGGKAKANGVTVNGNSLGVLVNNGAFLQFFGGTIAANFGWGVWAVRGVTFVCSACSITTNGGDGVHAEQGATVAFQTDFGVPIPTPYQVTRNGGAGVSLTNLANVSFGSGGGGGPAGGVGGSVSANHGLLDVACNASFTAAGGLANAGVSGARTNCAGP
jgi:hypothetical protein